VCLIFAMDRPSGQETGLIKGKYCSGFGERVCQFISGESSMFVHLNNNNTEMHKQNTNHVPHIKVYIKYWTGRMRGTTRFKQSPYSY